MVMYYCNHCDPEAKHRLFGKKYCPNCKNMLHYCCHSTGVHGVYTHLQRHVKNCQSCAPKTRNQRAIIQEPYASWLGKGEKKIQDETGIDLEVLDLVLRSTEKELKSVHGAHFYGKKQPLLSPENCLLMLLNFLRKNRTGEELDDIFSTTHSYRLLKSIAAVVYQELKAYVKFPTRIKRSICSGYLKGVVLFTDTSDTPINRPQVAEDRKLYYIKKGSKKGWAIKWQVSIGMDGHIWEHSHAYPFSVSDLKVFNDSKLPQFLQKHKAFGTGDAHYVNCTNMLGKRKGPKQSVAYKEYNIEIESVRNIIENLNHRIKIFKAMEGPWRFDRHNLDFFTHCLGIVCALINIATEKHPIRADLRTLHPRVSLARRAKKNATKQPPQKKQRLYSVKVV